MKSLSSYIGEELIFIQPSFFKREFELQSNSGLVAKMSYPKFFSLTALVEGFNEKYEIFKSNFWKSEVAIRKFGDELSFATLTSNFFRTRGKITLNNGRFVNLKFGLFKKLCEVFSDSGELLFEIKSQFSFKDKNIVVIHKQSSLIDENPWMIMIIMWFLIESRKGSAGS